MIIPNKTISKLYFIALLIGPAMGYAETKTVIATGIAVLSDKLSYNQAVMFALTQARVNAIEQAGVININNSTLVLNSATVADYIKTFTRGFIIEEEILHWTTRWSPNPNSRLPPYPLLSVEVKTKVRIPTERFMRHSAMDAKLNRSTFRNGENAIFEIVANENLYLLIVNYTSKGTILPIFPNDVTKNNFLKKNQRFTYPSARTNRVSIEINTYDNHDNDTEAFFVFGIPQDSKTKNTDWQKIFPGSNEMSYAEFHSKLLELPLTWLSEKILVYSVNKE